MPTMFESAEARDKADAEWAWMTPSGQASMRMCDDCSLERPLAWWGCHIRICEPCRLVREAAGKKPLP